MNVDGLVFTYFFLLSSGGPAGNVACGGPSCQLLKYPGGGGGRNGGPVMPGGGPPIPGGGPIGTGIGPRGVIIIIIPGGPGGPGGLIPGGGPRGPKAPGGGIIPIDVHD